MTVAEMHSEFKIGMDKVDSLSYPNLLPEEIDTLLNISQEKFIKQRAYGNNIRRQGLEETQKRLDDLKNIIANFETVIFTNTSSNKPNGVFVELPTSYQYAMEEEVDVIYTDCKGELSTKRVEVIPVTHDRYNRTIKDPFNKPFEDLVIRLGYGINNGNESFELVSNGNVTVGTYYLRYLMKPVKIQYGTQYQTPLADQDCILSDHTHREIIAIAIKDALENIESGRYPTTRQELNDIE